MKHQAVLLQETIDLLQVKPDGVYVDGTLGRGGHSGLLASKLVSGHLYAFDKDEQALAESKMNLAAYEGRITYLHADFRNMKEELHGIGVDSVDGILMDLGVSSPQFDDPERGFSYRFDARLDMRMDQEQELDACQVVNTYSQEDLTRIIRDYGEERYAGSIARSIVKQRINKPIETTYELVDVIKGSLPERELNRKGHPAKKTFQALRIEVNDEMGALEKGLQEALELLNSGGRLAVITFHSLEDRLVKQAFHKAASAAEEAPKIPILTKDLKTPDYILVTKKPVVADAEELADNKRAHSAKLRCIERR